MHANQYFFTKRKTKKTELVAIPGREQRRRSVRSMMKTAQGSEKTNTNHRNLRGSHQNETESVPPQTEDLNSSRSGKKTPKSQNTKITNWLSGSKKVKASGGKSSHGEVGDTVGEGEETDAVLVVTYEESSPPHRSPVRRPAPGMLKFLGSIFGQLFGGREIYSTYP